MLVVYTSSHGWGHNARMIPIINELYEYPIEVVTTAPEWFIRTSILKQRKNPLTIRQLKTDPGCVQFDPFTIDVEHSIEAWKDIFGQKDVLLPKEVEYLQTKGPIKLIISDISYFGQLVAEELKVPSVCVATFDWPFIYRDIRKNNKDISEIMDKIAEIDARFDYCLIPGSVCHPLKIGKKQVQFNWVSRKPHIPRPEMREILGLELHMDSCLLSFGGHAIQQIPQEVWGRFENWIFFVMVPNDKMFDSPARNVHLLPSEEWSGRHVDLVNTVDVVIGKLGYGLCSEVLTCNKNMLAVRRKGNPEDEVLKNYMQSVLPLGELTEEQFQKGEWYPINALVEMERNDIDYIKYEVNGEEQIGQWIRKLLGDRKPLEIDLYKYRWVILIFAMMIYLYFIKFSRKSYRSNKAQE